MAENTTQPAPATPDTPLYFAFGSNLWLAQMAKRCPSSPYKGLARLRGYKWIINTRGYANVVEVSSTHTTTEPTPSSTPDTSADPPPMPNDEVWGLVYALTPTDEAQLDVNEGVPTAYTKEYPPCDFWPAPPDSSSVSLSINTTATAPQTALMLVYIDRKRVTSGAPRDEYVYRMNRGIEDALERGVPRGYVEGVLRKWIKEDGGGEEEVRELASAQAGRFRDESGVF